MGIFSRLLGSDKVISGGMDLIDNAFYTDQEKADGKIKLLEVYQPFKLAQRYIALTFCVPYVVAWFVTFIASFWLEIDKQQELLTGDIGAIVGGVALFYFGGALAGNLRGK